MYEVAPAKVAVVEFGSASSHTLDGQPWWGDKRDRRRLAGVDGGVAKKQGDSLARLSEYGA